MTIMKKLNILLLAAVVMTGCNKFDEDINTNPNAPSVASGAQLINNAILSLSTLGSSPQGEYNAQYLSETQYPGGSLYPDGGTNFYGLYQGPLINLQKVLTSTLTPVDGPIVNQIAVAKILKAYYIWHITDRWGDVPYSEALKGDADFTPKYDTQKDIYDSLFKSLEEANAMFVAGDLTQDIMYGVPAAAGSINKWKRLGNSIRLLMALRLSEVDPAKAALQFNAALAAGVMTSNADNFVFKHLSDANNQNYWYNEVVIRGREWWAMSETLVNYMKPQNDPRLPVFGKTNSGGQYVGLPFGTTTGLPNTTSYSLMGTAIYAQSAPVYLVTYAQVLFAKAEAARRGWIPGGDAEAKANYDLAIEQSMRQWTGGTTGLAAFMTAPGIPYNAATALEQIGMQRYVHLYMHGYEAWAEWRRTGFPGNLVTPGGRAIPLRNAYPPNEVFNNTANYQEAVQRQFSGTDGLYGKVWWDKP
jgi:hypothetical protein